MEFFIQFPLSKLALSSTKKHIFLGGTCPVNSKAWRIGRKIKESMQWENDIKVNGTDSFVSVKRCTLKKKRISSIRKYFEIIRIKKDILSCSYQGMDPILWPCKSAQITHGFQILTSSGLYYKGKYQWFTNLLRPSPEFGT